MARDNGIGSSLFCLPVQTGVGSDLLMANDGIVPSHPLVLNLLRLLILSRLGVLLAKTQVHLERNVADPSEVELHGAGKLLRYISACSAQICQRSNACAAS